MLFLAILIGLMLHYLLGKYANLTRNTGEWKSGETSVFRKRMIDLKVFDATVDDICGNHV